jgi:predicted Zn-dependent protease
MTEESNLIPPKMLIVLEFLPACGMSFVKAGVRAGYSDSYARKLSVKFARDERLQKALHERMRRLLNEAGESDRLIVERILQRQHFNAHPIQGSYMTGRSPFAVDF